MNKLIALKLVIEQQSITKTAQIMGYSQPAVTQMLNNLEKEFGFSIVNKDQRQFKLTREGSDIYPFVLKLINDYQALTEKHNEITNQANQKIRIATIPSISQQWLPELISAFQFQNENVDFSIIQGDYLSIPKLIENGDADLGFINQAAVPEQHCTFIHEQTLKAVVPKEFQLALDVTELSLGNLTNFPYILLEEGLLSESLSKFADVGLKPRVKMRMHDSFSTLLMVEQQLGYTIMPVDPQIEANQHVRVYATKPQIKRKIGVISKDNPIMTTAAQRFLKFVVQHADELN